MSGLGLRPSALSAVSLSVRRSSTTQSDRRRYPSCHRIQPPPTKTSTSIIICRARMISHWTSGRGMAQVTAAFVFLGVTIALAIVLLQLSRALFHLAGSDFFDRFPLFPFTFPAAVIVQLCARRYNFEWAVNRRAVEGLGGFVIDGVIICAVGTLSLGAIGAYIGPLIILAVAGICWSVFVTLVIGRWIFPED